MGECLVNTDNFLIDNSDIEMAQNICKMITNTEVRCTSHLPWAVLYAKNAMNILELN